MLKEHVYNDSADDFGCSVGVAHITGYKSKKDNKTIENTEKVNNVVSLPISAVKFDKIKDSANPEEAAQEFLKQNVDLKDD